MTKQVERIMLWPQMVHIRMATKLEAAGIGKSSCVHKHIRNGTLRSLKGIGRAWEARIINVYSVTPRQLAEDAVAGRTKFVSNDGLDAAGFLLLAEGHLQKAEEKLRQRPGTPEDEDAMYHRLTIKGMAEIALTAVRAGLKMWKEEPCKP